MHERPRDILLSAWGRSVTRHPYLTLMVSLLLAATAVILTIMQLEFRGDRSDLVDPNLPWNRRYAEYKDAFPRWDDVVVVLEADADDDRVDRLARRIALTVNENPRVTNADAGFEVAETGPGLFVAAPDPLFDEVMSNLAEAQRLAAADHANQALAVALGGLAEGEPSVESIEQLESLLDPYLRALQSGDPPDFSFLRPDRSRWLPLVSEAGSGRLRFIQIQFDETGNGIARISDDVQWLRERVDRIAAASGIEGLDWGVTGIPVIEADETEQSIHDSTLASIIALTLITVMMLIVFRGIVVPLLAAISLLIGIAWSFGWLVLTIGHLQLLSVVFTVILLGLGIDFALHLVSRLELVQDEHEDLPSAIARVFRGIGPGMLTGAVTTAAAFGATMFTDFTGMKEMGIIAGGGVILCVVAMLSCFPAALAATRRWKRIIRHRRGGETAHFAHGRLDMVDFHPKGTLLAAGVIVLLLALPVVRLRYDPNVLNLQPPGIESVEWERRIVEDDARSIWAGLVEASAENAPQLVRRLRALPEVSGVGAMGLLVPPDLDARLERVAALRDRQPRLPSAASGIDALRQQMALVNLGLAQRVDGAINESAGRMVEIRDRIRGALSASARLDPEAKAVRWQALQDAYLDARVSLRTWLDGALAAEPPSPEDLPATLRNQWMSGDTWLLRVYPRAESRSILHPDRLGPFVDSVRDVAPNVFGPPVQIYESSKLIIEEYIKAACFAVMAILVILLIDFRSLADALCAMIPVLIGFIGVFGLMGLSGFPLNFANIIVMPLIFGIGVDAGVHVVHRWRAEPYGRPAGLSGGTGRGVTLTMLTTMIGFGCMVIAEHRGIRSLGFVMLAGLGVTLLACYIVLPAILRLRTTPWTRAARSTSAQAASP